MNRQGGAPSRLVDPAAGQAERVQHGLRRWNLVGVATLTAYSTALGWYAQ